MLTYVSRAHIVKPMKILVISDKIEESFLNTGSSTPILQGIELILACGDLPASYMEFMVSTLNVPLYYVLGNHDNHLYGQHINGCTCHIGRASCRERV